MIGRKDFAAGFLAVAVFCAAILPAAYAADPVRISQQNRKFNPDKIEIPRGTVLQIANDDRVTHHVFVDSPNMKFDSGEQPVGTTVDVTFDRTGSYTVLCAIHPTMKLQVTVQ